MKRFLRAVGASLSLLLLFWYTSPDVYRVLHLPDVIDSAAELSAPALSIREQSAKLVRESGDERIETVATREASVSLFGFLPLRTISVSQHTQTVMLGGQAIGVVLKTNGVQIVGFEKIESDRGPVCPAASAGLREGDMICAVNETPVTDSDSFVKACAAVNGTCELSCLREGTPFTASVTLARDRDGENRIGAWVRDSTSGIGTLSFYDRDALVYAALGHGVTDVDTQKLISPASGFITEATIREIRKGSGSEAGELVGQFSADRSEAIGTVDRNTPFGICGRLNSAPDRTDAAIPIGSAGSAHRGDAYILSTVDGNTTAYTVRVIRVDVQSSPDTRGMMIEITDPVLLEKTGGIVQGMSGSPLVQDGKLIGVVTHVFLSHPTRGYCLYAEWMSRELLAKR